jgi:hypothetical protein
MACEAMHRSAKPNENENEVVGDTIMADLDGVTGAQAGLSADDQIRIALETIIAYGELASMQQIYQAVDERLKPKTTFRSR